VKTYGQYCGLAKALDHVGDRWTLLIVRELLLGPRRYSQIRAALPGIATNLLADRLRELATEEIIRRNDNGTYELTEFGRGLEHVIHGLVRWGGRWMRERRKGEQFEPEWLAVALGALLPKRPRARIEIRAGDAVLSLDRDIVRIGSLETPDAVLEGAPEAILALAAGEGPLSAVSIRGDRAVVAAVFGKRPKR
jgi:DNA-binding HxlR family transcriptional regulator